MCLNIIDFKILVVSLPKDTVRRERVCQMFEKANFDWEFIYADLDEVDSLNYDENTALIKHGRALGHGELGCYASHLKCWNYVVSNKLEYALVIEDDVLIDERFDFNALIDFIHFSKIDYLRLYSRNMSSNKLLGLLGHRRFYRFKNTCYGTQGYLLSKLGAQKFLLSSQKGIFRPVDDDMDRFWENDIPNYAIYPYPLLEKSDQSTIRDKHATTTVSGCTFLLFWLNKKIDLILRNVSNLKSWFADEKIKKTIDDYNSKKVI